MTGAARAPTKRNMVARHIAFLGSPSRATRLFPPFATRRETCLPASSGFWAGYKASAASATSRAKARRKYMLIKRGLKHLSRVNDVLFRKLRIERDITI